MIYLMACFALVSWLSCVCLSRVFLANLSSCSVAIDISINDQFYLNLDSFLRLSVAFSRLFLVYFDSSANVHSPTVVDGLANRRQ